MAEEASGGFFNTSPQWATGSKAGNSTLSTRRSKGDDDDEVSMSHAAFSQWQIELQNKVTAEEEKRARDERMAFKAREDARFWQRKQELHQKTNAEMGDVKAKLADIQQHNHDQAATYKKELGLMKELMNSQREDWVNFGHELTVEYGQEQVERTRQSLLETAEEKARKGLEVRREEKRLEKQMASQRADALEEARQHVLKLKEEKIGKTEEAMNFALRNRQDCVDSVKRTEQKWKTSAETLREEYLGHALENKEKAISTNESMRESRKALIGARSTTVRSERMTKETNAQIIATRKEEAEQAKRSVHDAIFHTRKVGSDKQETVRSINRAKSPKKRAVKAGLVVPPPRVPSPYKIS